MKKNLLSQSIDLVRTGTSADHFYRNMNMTLRRLNDEFTMLHYPMEGDDNQTFLQSQKNLTDYCISLLDTLDDKHALEIGCGNGVQAMYIHTTYNSASMTGIDLDPDSIEIANSEMELRQLGNMRFEVDDAQILTGIATESMDVVINIESAFHYPDKAAFFDQIARVLKPGGAFMIADLLTTKNTQGVGIRRLWKRKMVLHHWKRDRYETVIDRSGLDVSGITDITGKVIKGFRNYRTWIRNMNKFGRIRDIIFRIFYIINMRWILYLLRNRREYLVFVGSKPHQ